MKESNKLSAVLPDSLADGKLLLVWYKHYQMFFFV